MNSRWIPVAQVGVVVALLLGVTMDVVDDGSRPAVTFGAMVAAFAIASTASGFGLAGWFWWGGASYAVVVVAGEAARAGEAPVPWVLWTIAGATVALSLVTLGAAVRAAWSSKELERLVFLESAALAFFATALGTLTYGLLEVWVDLPTLSILAIAAYGAIAWAAFAVAFGARYA